MNDTEIDYEAIMDTIREMLHAYSVELSYWTSVSISHPRCRCERKNILTDSYLTEEE